MSPFPVKGVLIACLLGASLAAAGCDRKSPAPEQAPAANVASADEVAPGPAPDEATGASGPTAPAQKIDRSHKGEAAVDAAFTAPDGKPTTLAAFRGKPLLLNLWATWCGPCVAEMPTLDAAAATLAPGVRVIAVSQDLQGTAKVAPFFAARKLAHLQPYLDPRMALSLAYRANLPTTILFDSAGREVWRMTGGFDWASAEAKALIAEAK